MWIQFNSKRPDLLEGYISDDRECGDGSFLRQVFIIEFRSLVLPMMANAGLVFIHILSFDQY
jgi:hypothetical protein